MAKDLVVTTEYCPSMFQVALNGPYALGDATFYLDGSCYDGELLHIDLKEFPARPTKRQVRKFKREMRKAQKAYAHEFD